MTQEEKLKEAKRLYESANADQRYVLESLFPELKESEDDRIRNFISNELACLRATDEKGTVRYNELTEAIAYLEKQVEQKPAEWHREDEQNLNVCLGYIQDEFLRRWLTDIIHVKYDKPADKVEPKFKVGDWVVWDNKIICHVDNIYQGKESLMYTITDTNNMIRSYSAKGFDNNARLWTIQDAKDGDVLCTYECDKPKIVFILKGTPKKHYALSYHCYCNIMYHHFAYDSEKGCLAPNDEDVKLATKEQRDLLFQKMKEAGYELDAENKQLKKIEQKPTWSEKDEEIYRKCICAMRASACGFPEEEKFVEQVDNWFKSLKDRVQPKQEWSEEDESHIRYLIECLEYCKKGVALTMSTSTSQEYINWLKSLRPQKQWKPSEEQMDAMQVFLEHGCAAPDKEASLAEKVIESLYNDLKKLREE